MSRVLVVDDDVGTRETVGALLTDAGFDVTTAATGASALGLARQFSFGTILLDFRLLISQALTSFVTSGSLASRPQW
jgi:DNA-binding response OmpR family regulator